MWVPSELKDPVVLHHPTRKSVGYYGAVRLHDGRFTYRREPDRFNAVTCHEFLIQLATESAQADRRVVVIIDNAKYHHAKLHKDWRDDIAERFVLEYLPPYSPDLNPIERLWKLTRRNCLHNRYFAELEEVIITVENQFDVWTSGDETVRRLCAII